MNEDVCSICGGLARFDVVGANGKQVVCDACLPEDVLLLIEEHDEGAHRPDTPAAAGHAAA